MSLFDHWTKKSAIPTPQKMAAKTAAKTAAPAAEGSVTEAVQEAKAPLQGSAEALRVLRRPHVSEKATRLTERGTYVFDVAVSAEKVMIKKAIESLYKVRVQSVRTVRHAGKPVRRGRRQSARAAWKKAVVTLAPGQKIEVYEGV